MNILNLIILDIIYNPKPSIDWTTIIATLLISIVLAILGFFIWKWQFIYQKKVEAYTNILPYIHKMENYFLNDLYDGGLFYDDKYCKKMQKEVLEFINEEQASSIGMLIFYFGESYGTSIGEISNILRLSAIFGWNEALNREEKEHIEEHFKIIYSIEKKLKSMGKWYNIKLF